MLPTSQWFYNLYCKSTSVFLQKDKPAFQTKHVESYHIKKNFVQSVQDFHCKKAFKDTLPNITEVLSMDSMDAI